jgi:hypothetical protein
VRRSIAAVVVVVLVSVPLAALYALLWSARSADHAFAAGERRGVRYLVPLTELINTVVEQQSISVRGRAADATAVSRSVAAMDAIDRELGAQLDSSDRWAKLRSTVLSVTEKAFADPVDAYTAYTELLDSAVALVLRIGDSSRLILDPQLDAYYVMNAALVRIPDVIVDGGRYADLVYLIASRKQTNQLERLAQLFTARLDVAEAAADLADGLEKAFDETRSETLGPAMLRELDNFRTAVDALVPRTAPTAAPSIRLEPIVVAGALDDLQRASLALDRAALGQLDLLLRKRMTAAVRELVLAGVVGVLGVLLVAAGAVWLPARRRRSPAPPPAQQLRPPGARHGERRDSDSVDARELVASSGLALPPRRGGTRAAR